MIIVPEATKRAYKNGSIKDVRLYFPDYEGGLTINTGNISLEAFEITQILEKERYLTFTGCNATQLKATIARLPVELKGQYVEARIQAGGTTIIPLFRGYVESQTIKNYATSTSEIIAYDALFGLSRKDIAQWYIHLWDNAESLTLKQFRDSLFEYLDIAVVTANLPNDNISIVKQYSPVQMNALDTIKALCQINGVYGRITPFGYFEFMVLPKIQGNSYPTIDYYKRLDYQRWSVAGIDKVTVRHSDDVEGASYGSGNNNYIVQSNILAYGLDDSILSTIAENIYPNVEGRAYVPFNAEIQGYPWIEVGDILTYKVYDYTDGSYTDMTYYVINRTLKGIQTLTDSQSADGEQYRTVFISNLNTKVNTIKDQIESIMGKLDSLSLQYSMFYNEDAIDIADGQRKAIASIAFGLVQPSQIHIEMEYLLICTTNDAVEVKMVYELDGTIIDSRQPIETFTNGKHIFSTYYVVNIPNTTTHVWRVFLECDGGSVHINRLQAQNTILGLGNISGDVWDGTIQAEEIVPALNFAEMLADFTDSVTASTQQPTTPTGIGDTVPALSFTGLLSGFTEGVEFDSIVENYTLDTSSTVTYDSDYVTTESDKFELVTEWVRSSSIVIVDSGYCTKVTPFTADVNVSSVEIT